MSNDIMVSVICNAYNHEKFIRQALEGFVMQKTDFKYEVLIHDDASKDRTADIIREYENKYPDIIKPIYQTKNQHSQGIRISKAYQYPRVKGKYIAFCEGDDCWICADKLQKQVEFMEAHPNCTMTCHNSKKIDYQTGKESIQNPVEKTGFMTAYDVVVNKPSLWIATASLVLRSELINDRPEFFELPPVGDMPLRYYCFAKGDTYYFEEVMSVYNYRTPGSWSAGRKLRSGNYIEFFEKYNEYTNYKYDEYLKEEIRKYEFRLLAESYDFKALRVPKYRDLYRQMSFKAKLYIFLYTYFPIFIKLHKFCRKIRNKR